MDVLDLLRTGAALLAAGGVLVGVLSLRTAREQAKTSFEDALAREYREIAGMLPPSAFYAGTEAKLDQPEMQAMFRYFDLSNEQLRLIDEGRIRDTTAEVWRAGIRGLLEFDTFRAAWSRLHPGLPADFFTSLSELLTDSEAPAASSDSVADGTPRLRGPAE